MSKAWKYLQFVQDSVSDGPKNETLAEHREHCEAEPGNCPFEKKADKTDDLTNKAKSEKTSEQLDAEYMDAVKRGDMETAQMMVREAAAQSMPNTKIVDNDGLPLVVWHGGTFGAKGNTIPDLDGGEIHFGTKLAAEERVAYKYAAMKVEDPEFYRINVGIRPFFLNLENPKSVEDNNGSSATWLDYANIEDRSYDGVVYENESEDKGSKSYGVSWYKSSIKSADPVTYDDAGNIIPLSHRFDMKNTDIRY